MEQIFPIKEAEEFVISMANKSREEVGTQELMKERHVVRRKFWITCLKEINKATPLYQNVSPSKEHRLSAGSGISGVIFTTHLIVASERSMTNTDGFLMSFIGFQQLYCRDTINCVYRSHKRRNGSLHACSNNILFRAIDLVRDAMNRISTGCLSIIHS